MRLLSRAWVQSLVGCSLWSGKLRSHRIMVPLLAPCGQKNKFFFFFVSFKSSINPTGISDSPGWRKFGLRPTRFLFTQFIPRDSEPPAAANTVEALSGHVSYLVLRPQSLPQPTGLSHLGFMGSCLLSWGCWGTGTCLLHSGAADSLPSLLNLVSLNVPSLPSTWGHSKWTLS